MDDFNISTLHDSKSEWASRLLTILTPLIIEGLRSIFDEAYKLCKDNNEETKYLMTFQNFISRIPKWNPTVIEQERKRIIEKSGCHYLEELITCVHIIQLKILTAMRVGSKQKKIDINIPKLDEFIHKCYILVARKIYKNVYLFEIGIPPLQIQKNNRELELIVQECILNTIREGIPVESILKAYLDETVEEDVVEEIKEEKIEVPLARQESKIIEEVAPAEVPIKQQEIKFNDMDLTRDDNNNDVIVNAPKSIERLEEISEMRNNQRKLESEEEEEEGLEKIQISDQDYNIQLDIEDINGSSNKNTDDIILDDIEILS